MGGSAAKGRDLLLLKPLGGRLSFPFLLHLPLSPDPGFSEQSSASPPCTSPSFFGFTSMGLAPPWADGCLLGGRLVCPLPLPVLLRVPEAPMSPPAGLRVWLCALRVRAQPVALSPGLWGQPPNRPRPLFPILPHNPHSSGGCRGGGGGVGGVGWSIPCPGSGLECSHPDLLPAALKGLRPLPPASPKAKPGGLSRARCWARLRVFIPEQIQVPVLLGLTVSWKESSNRYTCKSGGDTSARRDSAGWGLL